MTYPDPKVQGELESWKRLSVDVDEQSEIAGAFGIRSIPTAIALASDGRVLATIQGFHAPDDFAALLAEARSAAE